MDYEKFTNKFYATVYLNILTIIHISPSQFLYIFFVFVYFQIIRPPDK